MPSVAAALDAAAGRHQRESDKLQTAIELVMMDLMFRIGREQSVTDWVALGTARLEAGATSYANLTTRYLDTQLAILSPKPPPLPIPDLSWVRDNLDQWLPSSMVMVNGRVDAGEAIADVLTEMGPKIQRQVSAFTNQVEARTVTQALTKTGDFWTFDMNRPSTAELRRSGLPLTPDGLGIDAGIAELEKYANEHGYPITKRTGKTIKIQILPQIGACGFCIVRADRLYSESVLHGERIRSHTACRCDWRFVTRTEADTWRPVLRGSKATDIIDRRSSPDPNAPAEGDLTP